MGAAQRYEAPGQLPSISAAKQLRRSTSFTPSISPSRSGAQPFEASAAVLDELLSGAGLNQAPLVEDVNEVGVADRGELVGDQYDGLAASGQPADLLEDLQFGLGAEGYLQLSSRCTGQRVSECQPGRVMPATRDAPAARGQLGADRVPHLAVAWASPQGLLVSAPSVPEELLDVCAGVVRRPLNQHQSVDGQPIPHPERHGMGHRDGDVPIVEATGTMTVRRDPQGARGSRAAR